MERQGPAEHPGLAPFRCFRFSPYRWKAFSDQTRLAAASARRKPRLRFLNNPSSKPSRLAQQSVHKVNAVCSLDWIQTDLMRS